MSLTKIVINVAIGFICLTAGFACGVVPVNKIVTQSICHSSQPVPAAEKVDKWHVTTPTAVKSSQPVHIYMLAGLEDMLAVLANGLEVLLLWLGCRLLVNSFFSFALGTNMAASQCVVALMIMFASVLLPALIHTLFVTAARVGVFGPMYAS